MVETSSSCCCRCHCSTMHFFKSTPPVTVCKAPWFLSAQSPGHSPAEKGCFYSMPPPSALPMSTLQKMAEINKGEKKGKGASLGSERLELSVGLSLEWLPLSRKQSLSFLALALCSFPPSPKFQSDLWMKGPSLPESPGIPISLSLLS